MTATAVLLADALAVYAVLIAHWLADRRVRRLRADGHPADKTALYRRAIGMQVVMTSAVAALWLFGGIPAASLGVRIPHAWAANIAAGGVIVSYFAVTAVRRRSRAHDLRERMRARGGQVLLPDTRSELGYFAALCAGTGVAEELVYRGLLMFLIGYYAPHITIVVVTLHVSAI